MSLIGVSVVYAFMMYGFVLLLTSFDGPFNIVGKFRDLLHWLHPQLGKLIECPYCTCTWVGGFISSLNYLLISVKFTPFNIILCGTGLWWLIIPFDTFFACGCVWLLHVIDDYYSSNVKVEYEDD